MRALLQWLWSLIASLLRLAPAKDPAEGERIPGTDYIRCANDCRKFKKPDSDEVYRCIPDESSGHTPCTPNNPDIKERCHCLGFGKLKKGDWEVLPKEWKVDQDKYDGQVCWCARYKKAG